MRIALHQITVLECAWLGLIRVADYIFRFWRVFRNEAPLHSGGKSCAASTTQSRFLDVIDDVVRRHRCQYFFYRLITAVLSIHVDRRRVFEQNSPELKGFAADGANEHRTQ